MTSDSNPNPFSINLANLKLLSHSAIQLLRRCPRQYELDRLLTQRKDEGTIHTAFGSAMGSGIQKILETKDFNAGLIAAFMDWHVPLSEEAPKAYKSFPHVYLGLKYFYDNILESFGDWEIAYLSEGKPAIELSFAVLLPRGYWYRGFLDGVLVNKRTKKYRVLELKTTGARYLNEAMYGNSFQGVGYSIVLDKIVPEGYSDYEVLYLVYKTFNQTFEDLPFLKTSSHRINWLNDLLLEVERIEAYQRVKRFPQNGDSCMAFNRTCRFYEDCNYSNDSLFAGQEIINSQKFDPDEFDFVFDLEDLLRAQQGKI